MDFTFSEDAELIRTTLHEFVRRDLLPLEPKFLNARGKEEREEIKRSATAKLKEMGLYSAGVPEEFGGGGLGLIETCIIAEELSTTVIPIEWGDFTPLLYECSDSQRSDYLLPVVAGEKTYAIAFREPKHFAHPNEMTTTAQLESDRYILNGIKELSRADFDFCLVFARTPAGTSCFIVERDLPNTEIILQTEPPQLILNRCAVTIDKILGKPGMAMSLGQKWFGLGRITRSAAILGVCRRILETSALYARDWKSMNEPIISRKEIQRTLASMSGNLEALRWLVYYTAWLASTNAHIQFDSMLLKLQAQNVLKAMVTDAIRIHGGTIPPLEHWLVKASGEGEAFDMLCLAVSHEVIARYIK
ncbi:MAG: acyl-CoA dehydrogenase family protein [candidate division WOR-3 bacterium]